MSEEVLMFWLIHLFLGIIVPVLMLTGCCRRDEDQEAEVQPLPRVSNQNGEGWESGHAK